MLILLPPSEGKAEPDEGSEPVDLDSLVFAAELGATRRELLEAFDPCLLERPATLDVIL